MADLNVASDVALCRACGLVHKLSSLLQAAKLEEGVDLACPPAGAWYRDSGFEAVIGATHRSVATVMGLLAFSLFWNGIVSVFVFFAFNSTLHLLDLPRPAWFPSPKNQWRRHGLGHDGLPVALSDAVYRDRAGDAGRVRVCAKRAHGDEDSGWPRRALYRHRSAGVAPAV